MYEYNLGTRFQNIAAKLSDNTAIWLSEHELFSYHQLNGAANQIGRSLVDRGVSPRDVVFLSGEKSFFTFACIIGCLKIGAIYSVLDPDSPAERSRRILTN